MDKKMKDFIKNALFEDLGNGDITSLACINKESRGKIQIIAKEPCQIAGIEIVKYIYHTYDSNIELDLYVQDGESVKKNNVILEAYGRNHSLLATERLILNCMQRMSGIATKTHHFVEQVKDLGTIILDTRKTCPGIRFLDKMAVKIGGGQNHRNGLYDMIMIKDNHIDFSGGIKHAINNCQNYLTNNNSKTKIIIEVRTLKELYDVVRLGGIDRILLDNFSIKKTRKAVEIVNQRYPLESSGNIRLNNVRNYALCGVEYISIGALTHSIKNIDLSMICIE